MIARIEIVAHEDVWCAAKAGLMGREGRTRLERLFVGENKTDLPNPAAREVEGSVF